MVIVRSFNTSGLKRRVVTYKLSLYRKKRTRTACYISISFRVDSKRKLGEGPIATRLGDSERSGAAESEVEHQYSA
jgi:predicted transcriptional regulator with HTH domain